MDGHPNNDESWPTTGEHFDVSRGPVHIPTGIRDFLNLNDIFCLVASKGMGKTIFLKYKLHLIREQMHHPGVLIIPSTQELDFVSLPRNLSRPWIEHLQTPWDWADLWRIAIVFSLYLNQDDQADFGDEWIRESNAFRFLYKEFSRKLKERAIGEKTFRDTPSNVLGYLLSMQSVSNFIDFKNEILPNLTRFYVDHFRNGAYVFIDSFDQSLADVETLGGDSKIWANGQIGLAKAAWQLNRQNPHIKVFTSIRQEAFAQFSDEDRMAMQGSLLVIKLQNEDLDEMFNHLVQHYENVDSIEEMTGLRQVRNINAEKTEDVFDYIRRHTLGKPREFAVIGREIRLSGISRTQSEDARLEKLRDIVNEVSASEVKQSYLKGEMARFMTDLGAPENLDCFLRLIPHAILSADEIDRINKEFAREAFNSDKLQTRPFCELYNVGLLGVIVRDYGRAERQRFKRPFEFDIHAGDRLPESKHYLLHPALHSALRPEAKGCLDGIIVGEGAPWTPDYDAWLDSQTRRIFLSYCHDNRLFVQRFEDELFRQFDYSSMKVDIWRDVWRMKTGALIQEQMQGAIRDADVMIAILSEQAVEAGHMKSEWQTMLSIENTERAGIRLMPVAKDDVTLSHFAGLQPKAVLKLPNLRSKFFAKSVSKLCSDIAATPRKK